MYDHMRSIEAKDVIVWATLVATFPGSPEDKAQLEAAISAFRAIGGTDEQIEKLLARANRQAQRNLACS